MNRTHLSLGLGIGLIVLAIFLAIGTTFGYHPPPRIGNVYALEDDNPFTETSYFRIIDVKGKYYSYSFTDNAGEILYPNVHWVHSGHVSSITRGWYRLVKEAKP